MTPKLTSMTSMFGLAFIKEWQKTILNTTEHHDQDDQVADAKEWRQIQRQARRAETPRTGEGRVAHNYCTWRPRSKNWMSQIHQNNYFLW
jgi:hypothetical protein